MNRELIVSSLNSYLLIPRKLVDDYFFSKLKLILTMTKIRLGVKKNPIHISNIQKSIHNFKNSKRYSNYFISYSN